jgi:hypothetical protein
MKQIIVAAALLGAIFAGQQADAQTRTPQVNKQQYNQHKRIEQGARNGSLTKHETRNLKMQQAKVRHYKQMAKADGRVTRNERMMIHRAQKNANRNIYCKKHNDRYRG